MTNSRSKQQRCSCRNSRILTHRGSRRNTPQADTNKLILLRRAQAAYIRRILSYQVQVFRSQRAPGRRKGASALGTGSDTLLLTASAIYLCRYCCRLLSVICALCSCTRVAPPHRKSVRGPRQLFGGSPWVRHGRTARF